MPWRLELHTYHHRDPQVDARLRAVEHTLGLINERTKIMAKTLDDLIAQANATLVQVTTNTDLDSSIIAIVTAQAATLVDLRAQLTAAGTDPTKLATLGDAMDAMAAKAAAEGQITAAAVTANTSVATPAAG